MTPMKTIRAVEKAYSQSWIISRGRRYKMIYEGTPRVRILARPEFCGACRFLWAGDSSAKIKANCELYEVTLDRSPDGFYCLRCAQCLKDFKAV